MELFSVGVSVAKSILYKWLGLASGGPGYCHFPMSYDEEHFLQLTAEKKITKKRRGHEVVEWIKEYERNEALDCRNYAYAAVVILNPVWDVLAGKKISETEGPKRLSVEEQELQSRRERRGRSSKRGFVRTW